MSGAFWRIVSLVLLVAQLLAVGGMGYGWSLAAHDRDAVTSELGIERTVSETLRVEIGKQNDAVKALEAARLAAEARGDAARAIAAANGRRFDAALERERGATATTCADAMPVVDRILESIR